MTFEGKRLIHNKEEKTTIFSFFQLVVFTLYMIMHQIQKLDIYWKTTISESYNVISLKNMPQRSAKPCLGNNIWLLSWIAIMSSAVDCQLKCVNVLEL